MIWNRYNAWTTGKGNFEFLMLSFELVFKNTGTQGHRVILNAWPGCASAGQSPLCCTAVLLKKKRNRFQHDQTKLRQCIKSSQILVPMPRNDAAGTHPQHRRHLTCQRAFLQSIPDPFSFPLVFPMYNQYFLWG